MNQATLEITLGNVLRRYTKGPDSGIFTDGSAQPNPGPGGWGVVYVNEGKVLSQLFGEEEYTTNNRMELTALVNAFKVAPGNEAITIFSDSELCVKTINEWAPKWEKNGWKKKTGPIKNLELVQELLNLRRSRPKAKLEWIKGHGGWRWNEYAHTLSIAWTLDG